MREEARCNLGPGYRLCLDLLSFPSYVGTDRLPDVPITDKSSCKCADGGNPRQSPADELQMTSKTYSTIGSPFFIGCLLREIGVRRRCIHSEISK
jgi:hypothetical protein